MSICRTAYYGTSSHQPYSPQDGWHRCRVQPWNIEMAHTVTPDSVSRPLRFRTRASAHTLIILPSHPQPLLRAQLEFPIQLGTRLLLMNEVTKPSPHATLPTVQPTTSLSEIRHGTEFAVDRSRGIPSRIERVAGRLRRLFVLEPRIHVADQVVVVIVAHHDFLELAVLAHLAPDVFVEGVEVVL